MLDECAIERPPVNLYRIAKQQRICRVKELDTQLDGQLLELETGEYEVILSRNAPSSRKRFTLAHEIAHVLLVSEGDAEGLNCDDSVEDLCNAIASEILMPRRFLRAFLTKELMVGTLLEAAKLFGCSLEAAGWKILNQGLARGTLLIWSIKKLGSERVLELMASPQTFGLKMPFKRGMVLSQKHSLWQACMEEDSGPIKFANSPDLRGEFARLNKTVVMLFTAAEERESMNMDIATGARQGRFTF